MDPVAPRGSQASETESDLAVLVGDVDYFKRVNDIAGHVAGDRYLKKVARAIKRVKRDADEAFRWAGDEFAVLLPGADVDGARDLDDRINAEVGKIATPEGLDPLRFTFGHALFDPEEEDPTDFLLVADKILVKKKGERPRQP